MTDQKEIDQTGLKNRLSTILSRVLNRNVREFITGLLVVVFTAIWIIGLTDQVIMPLVVRGGVSTEVPEICGQPVRQAERICLQHGLVLERLDRMRIDNQRPSGTVIDQFPGAGLTVKPGRQIEVVLSVQEGLIRCPDVIGKSPREARLIADSTGLVIDQTHVSYQHSSEFPEGVVVVQVPQPLSQISRGDSLLITISLGEIPTEMVIPKLVGGSMAEAEFTLAKYGLKLGQITRFPQRNSRAGTILSQNPLPGVPCETGAKVDLRVSIIPQN